MAPVLPVIGTNAVSELALLTVTNTAVEADVHAAITGYGFLSAPAGMTVGTNGIITWTPGQNQSPGTNTVTTVVTNNDPYDLVNPVLLATNSFVVIVKEVNVAPVLPVIGTNAVSELALLTVTNTAVEADVHAAITGYGFLSAPAGMTVGTNGIITWTPGQNQSPGTNTVTTVVTNNDPYDLVNPVLLATNSFVVIVKEVNVAPVLPVIGTNAVSELALLTVTNTAVEADVHAAITGYGFLSAPAGMTVGTNGIITWTPGQNQSPGTNTVTTVVTNNDPYDLVNPVLLATNSFVVIVKEVNVAPVLPVIGTNAVSELALLTVTNTAVEADVHAAITGYGFLSAPAGMTVGTNGIITWTPGQNQSPGTNTVTTVVTNNDPYDLVNPVLLATNSFVVIVKEVNVAPVLPVIGTNAVSELALLTVTNTAVEADVHAAITGYGFLSAPAGMTVGTNGIITWTPGQNQSPGTNTVTTVVTNNDPYDLVNPVLLATNSFVVIVKEVNVAPVLPVIGTNAVSELALLTVTNTAVEADVHAAITGYGFLSAPAGMTVGTNGIITWTPGQNQSPGTNTVTTVVTNNDPYDLVNPVLLATNSFVVIVKEVNVAPVLPVIGTNAVSELALLTVTNTAVEADVHAAITGYGFLSAPAGMTVGTNGIITWTPGQNQSPGTNTVTTVVTNNDPYDLVNPVLLATNSFVVIVKEVNVAPVLPVIGTNAVSELALLTVTNTAVEADVHAAITGYGFLSAPAGMTVGTNGIITWTPGQNQSPGTNTVTTVVTNNDPYDLVNPVLLATNSFVVIVKEVNVAPVLPVIGTNAVSELALLTVTNTAVEADVHAAITGYGFLSAPAGMTVGTNGIITWTPGQNQSPGTNTVTTVVTNNDPYDLVNPVLLATNSFVVIVKEVNVAPVLPVIGTNAVSELALLTVTNTAVEADVHAAITGYGFLSAPAGMTVGTNGIITWTPGQNQSPGTNTVTTVVTNNDPYDLVNPVLLATNSFVVIVKEVNVAPVLPVIGTNAVSELALLTVTNTAVEADVHAAITGYGFLSAPAGMTVGTNGIITWTPGQNQSPGTNTVTTVVTNNDPYDLVNPVLLATNSFVVIVKEVNVAPVLPVIGTNAVSELALLTVTNTAVEADVHAAITGYGFLSAPAGMTVGTNGIITWTPGQNQSPGTNTVTTVVTNNDPYDLVNPVLLATNSFVVIVKEVNVAPVLPVIGTNAVSELALLTVTNTAVEADVHAAITGYGFLSAPAGMTVGTNGIITWTPGQNQSPGTNTVTTVVTNNDPYDLVNPVLLATNSFVVIVKEVNVAPVLPVIGTNAVSELALLTVTNTAVEADVHAAITGYGFLSAPAGMTVGTNGIITWTPGQNQSPGTNTVTTVVTNNDPYDLVNPVLLATNSFVVIVKEVNVAPVLPVIGTNAVSELALLTVTNTAVEADVHAAITGYGFLSAPAGMTVGTNGIITWTPGQNQSPGTNTVTTVVTNNDPYDLVNPVLLATNSFVVIVKEVNVAPVLPVIGTNAVSELALLTVTNTAVEADVHAAITGYGFLSAPAGMTVGTNGIITWTPGQNQSPGTNTVTTVVTNNDPYDLVNPVLLATNSFVVIVKEVNVAPVLPVIGTNAVSELALLTVTNTAVEADVHAAITGYGFLSAPAGMTVGTNGIITWTPGQNQSPGTNTVTTVVTNNDPYDLVNPVLLATNSFVVIVKEVNVAPVLPVIGTNAVSELALLTVTNTAVEADVHAAITGYGFLSAPAGMTVGTNGIITWTPGQNQSPGTNTVTTVVTNNDPYDLVNPVLLATNSFVVIVKEVNVAPVLPVIGTNAVSELALLTVTNTAVEADVHAAITGYGFLSAPAGMTVGTNGIITWTPGQNQSPGTNTVTTVVTNNDPVRSGQPGAAGDEQLCRHCQRGERGTGPAGDRDQRGQRAGAADGDEHGGRGGRACGDHGLRLFERARGDDGGHQRDHHMDAGAEPESGDEHGDDGGDEQRSVRSGQPGAAGDEQLCRHCQRGERGTGPAGDRDQRGQRAGAADGDEHGGRGGRACGDHGLRLFERARGDDGGHQRDHHMDAGAEPESGDEHGDDGGDEQRSVRSGQPGAAGDEQLCRHCQRGERGTGPAGDRDQRGQRAGAADGDEHGGRGGRACGDHGLRLFERARGDDGGHQRDHHMDAGAEPESGDEHGDDGGDEQRSVRSGQPGAAGDEQLCGGGSLSIPHHFDYHVQWHGHSNLAFHQQPSLSVAIQEQSD